MENLVQIPSGGVFCPSAPRRDFSPKESAVSWQFDEASTQYGGASYTLGFLPSQSDQFTLLPFFVPCPMARADSPLKRVSAPDRVGHANSRPASMFT